MSDQIVTAIIGAVSGLSGVVIGAFLSYRLQLKLEYRRREDEARRQIHNQLTEGVGDFAKWMKDHGTEFIPSDSPGRGPDLLTRIGQVLFLLLFAAIILMIFVSSIRKILLEFLLSTPPSGLAAVVLIIGFISGWTLIRTSKSE